MSIVRATTACSRLGDGQTARGCPYGSMLLRRKSAVACTLFLLLLGISRASANDQAAASASVPNAQQIQRFVRAFFAKQPGFQDGDLITQGAVRQLLDVFAKKGLDVKDADLLLERVLPDNDFLVRQFRDERGRAFLRHISALPGGIDRVDRLARMPQGQASVNDLIRKVPNGYEWIEAMTTTRRGKELGKRLSNTRSGKGFNEPTSRIYSVDELIKELNGRLVPTNK